MLGATGHPHGDRAITALCIAHATFDRVGPPLVGAPTVQSCSLG
jgi:hypothetical protein